MSFVEVAVTVNRDQAPMVSDWLSDQGALSVTVESAADEIMFDEAEPGEPAWQHQVLTALYDDSVEPAILVSALNGVVGNESASLATVEDQDWERSWLDQFKPIAVTPTFWICPTWTEGPADATHVLRLDPGLAFGTGTHPTTFLCLKQLCAMDLVGKRVVDYGCGSGILAIAALLLGASKAWATDVDPRALEATKENAIANGVADRLSCVVPEQLDAAMKETDADSGCDLVIGNILAGTLIRLAPVLRKLVGQSGELLLSGILREQIEEVSAAYVPDFTLERTIQGDWTALFGRRSVGNDG